MIAEPDFVWKGIGRAVDIGRARNPTYKSTLENEQEMREGQSAAVTSLAQASHATESLLNINMQQ